MDKRDMVAFERILDHHLPVRARDERMHIDTLAKGHREIFYWFGGDSEKLLQVWTWHATRPDEHQTSTTVDVPRYERQAL